MLALPPLWAQLSPDEKTGLRDEKPTQTGILKREIPNTREKLTAVGLGTWRHFDAEWSDYERLEMVIDVFRSEGGQVIDTSPMYGMAETVLGVLTGESNFFRAGKIFTTGENEGLEQFKLSLSRMRVRKLDLLQVHNLLDVRTHIKTLRRLKEEGRIRYLGLTHYQESVYGEMASLMREMKPDFIQISYNVRERAAEKELLPLAQQLKIAVLVNQPFGGGSLLPPGSLGEVPGFARELGCRSRAQALLKFVLSHEAVTCVLTGTGNSLHMKENMRAAHGDFPEEKDRERWARALVNF